MNPDNPTTTGEQILAKEAAESWAIHDNNPTTGDRYVMVNHLIFDKRANAFIGAGDACHLLNEINTALAAERENVEIAHRGMDHYHDQAEQLAAAQAALVELLTEIVEESAVQFEDIRIDYKTVQITSSTWDKLQAWHAAKVKEGK